MSDAKFKEKLTSGLKYDMKDLLNFHPLKNPNVLLGWAIFAQSIWGLSQKDTEELSFMTLNSDAKFE